PPSVPDARPLRRRPGWCRPRPPDQRAAARGHAGCPRPRLEALLRARDQLLRVPPDVQEPVRPRGPLARGGRAGAPGSSRPPLTRQGDRLDFGVQPLSAGATTLSLPTSRVPYAP